MLWLYCLLYVEMNNNYQNSVESKERDKLITSGRKSAINST